jgi:hypothetical protein
MEEIKENSANIGRAFEQAACALFEELFVNWGYQVIEAHPQKSGSQHGGDIVFKLSRHNLPLHIFVECKTSKDFREKDHIDVAELVEKVRQFDQSGFLSKDIHLFLSMSKIIKYNNQTTTIEDNSYPFVIVNWMKKENKAHPVMELFAAYEGTNPIIEKYRQYLKDKIGSEFSTKKNFTEVAKDLEADFQRRIEEHCAWNDIYDFRIINGAFWNRAKEREDKDAFFSIT